MAKTKCNKYLVVWKHTTDEWIRRANNKEELYKLINKIKTQYGHCIQGTIKVYSFVTNTTCNNTLDKLEFFNNVYIKECLK